MKNRTTIKPLRFFLNSQLKYSKLAQRSGGFTLIELLVALVLAALVITPLLGFMIDIMNSDRKEQAKARSEQEIQSALDYIAKDLQEAVYIYDADGITAINNQLPDDPTFTGEVPVIVFWKREFQENVVPISNLSPCPPPPDTPEYTPDNCNDAFVYSLVAYYLYNNSTSSPAHIRRFQVSDGVKNPNSPNVTDYLASYPKNAGFKLFDLTLPGTLQQKMNAWTKSGSYNLTINPIRTLVYYIDQSTGTVVPPPPNCNTISSTAQQVPSTLAGGFYACVDSSKTLARVYLRGNALARISNNATYITSKSTYFPTASIQVQGRGVLGNE